MNSCSLHPPGQPGGWEASGAERAELLRKYKRIAVVGLSANPDRPSHFVTSYLINNGYEIAAVNPSKAEILGLRCVASLGEVPGPLEIVNIFRTPSAVPGIVEDAIASGAKAVWMQPGAVHSGAARKAHDAGLIVVTDRCIMVEHANSFA